MIIAKKVGEKIYIGNNILTLMEDNILFVESHGWYK